MSEPIGRTVVVTLPTNIKVLVYKSSQHAGWITSTILEATDVVTGEPGSFGSVDQYTAEPTLRQIADHIIDQLRHEIEEQLGMSPHDKAD